LIFFISLRLDVKVAQCIPKCAGLDWPSGR
jgi:hypothetical protein